MRRSGGRGSGDRRGWVGRRVVGGRSGVGSWIPPPPTALHHPPPPSTALHRPPGPTPSTALHGPPRRYTEEAGGREEAGGGGGRGERLCRRRGGGKPQGAPGATGGRGRGGEAPLLKPAARPLPALVTLAVQMAVSSCARGRAGVGARVRAGVGARVTARVDARARAGFGFGLGLGLGFGLGRAGLGFRPG